jgi:hypothetical protein
MNEIRSETDADLKKKSTTAREVSKKSKPDGTHPWTYGKLDSPAKIIRFIGEVPRLIFEGKISARTGGAVNGAVRNLMACYGLDDYQRKNPLPSNHVDEDTILGFINTLPAPLRNSVMAHLEERAKLELSSESG